MKKIFTKQFFALAIFAGGSIFVAGQDIPKGPPAAPPEQQLDRERPGKKRMQPSNLLRSLNLSAEQIKQLRKMHSEKRPAMAEAMRRFNESNKALDDAIYADVYDQGRIDSLLKAREVAQWEFFRVKTEIEIEIRRLLTPEQLMKFRELRLRHQPGDVFLRDRRPGPPKVGKEKPPVL